MTDTRELLERASRAFPPAGYDLEAVRARGERRRRAERMRAGALGMTLAIVVGILAFVALDGTGLEGDGLLGNGDAYIVNEHALPPATVAPLEAGQGEYHHRAVLLVGCIDEPVDACPDTGYRLDATSWWSPVDDSGRIAIDDRRNVDVAEGRFGPGAFPNEAGVDVTGFPLDPSALAAFLLDRSDESGASPVPLITPPPEGAPRDGQLWRSITDLLGDPHVTPAVRSALLDVAAGLRGAHVTLDTIDPFGRAAHLVEFGNWGGEQVERLYLDPSTHELLCWTKSAVGAERPFEYFVVQDAGVVGTTESGPAAGSGSVPVTLLSASDLRFGPLPPSGGVLDDDVEATESTGGLTGSH